MSGKLFLGGISANTDEKAIREHFEQFGPVIDSVVMYKDGKHRGFGFITYEDPASAIEALSQEHVIDERTIDVKDAVPQGEAPGPSARPSQQFAVHGGGGPRGGNGRHDRRGGADPSEGPRTDKCFVGGLTQTTTDDQLRDYFAQYGNLVDVVVMKDRASQRSRGFGFVQYDDTEPIERVMAEYSSHRLDGKWVEVKRAQPKDRMVAQGSAPSQQMSPYGKGGGGGPPAASQFYPWGGAYPPHPYGGYCPQYGGYYHQPPPGYNPYGVYDPYYGAPGVGMPTSAYPAAAPSDGRARPY